MHKRMLTSSLLTIGALLLVAGGCKNQPVRGSGAGDTEAVNTGLNAIGRDSGLLLPGDGELVDEDGFGSVSDQIAESARQLDVYFANIDIDGVEEVDAPARERIEFPSVGVEQGTQEVAVLEESDLGEDQERVFDGEGNNEDDNSVTEEADEGGVRVSLLSASGQRDDSSEPIGEADSEEGDVAGGDAAVDGAQDPSVRKDELMRELAVILSEMAASSDDPGSAALALAGLEILLPADTESLVDDGVLSDGERASLDAARDILRSMSSEGSIASPAEIADDLERIQLQLGSWVGLTIKKAALCTQVDGFGRYETFPSYRFVAGRAQLAIVYIELERFVQREFVGPDGQARFESKISQRIELYHAADDLNVWNLPVGTVTDVSRNHLRDYYLINQITLPGTLGVGRYHLKVVMRDLIGKKVAETIVPIEIVAR